MGITERPPSPFSKRQNPMNGGENNDIPRTKAFSIGCLCHAATETHHHEEPPPSPPHPLHRPPHSIHLVHSLSRLSSSRRLSVTCSGSDLGQLYLSSPEQDAVDFLFPSNGRRRSFRRNWGDDDYNDDTKPWRDGGRNFAVASRTDEESEEKGEWKHSWMEAVDLYGRRTSFSSCRRNSYVTFLKAGVVDDDDEEEEEEISFLIEETHEDPGKMPRWWTSPSLMVPLLMLLDLALGISLSLYDSNLLRNVPGFHFPLCYAWIQKFTNALASLVLIFLSQRWETIAIDRERLRRRQPPPPPPAQRADIAKEPPWTKVPSVQVFRRHVIPLTAIAIVQTISAGFANLSLQILPLPLFKVVLMCGPIFVAFLTSAIEGNVYSKGRIVALSLIGIGAVRAVYAEAEGADNPRSVMEGAAYALGASALSGMGLVISGVLMHGGSADQDDELDSVTKEEELNPLSLLFYLSCEQVAMLSFYLFPWEVLWSESRLQVVVHDGSNELLEFIFYSRQNPHQAVFYLMLGSTISFCLAILTFTLVTRTSPVAASLLGNVRSIATVAISSFLWGHVGDRGIPTSVFGSAALGYVLTLVGGVTYALSPATRTAKNT